MPSSKLKDALRIGSLVLAALALYAMPSLAENERIRLAVGRGEVVTSNEDVQTVAIAEPKIADAAVGSARSVVVNAKSPGTTTLVVYNESGHYKMYDIEVYEPNSEKQVKLHVTVSELSNDAVRELGLDVAGDVASNVPWLDGSLTGGLFTTKVAPPSIPLQIGQRTDGALGYSRNDGRLNMQTTWRALEQKGDIRTLANPTLVASSGQKASFLSGGQFPVPISTAGATAGGANGGVTINNAGVSIEWKEFGVKVDFTPQVMDDGTIFLTVTPEVSQLDFTNTVTIGGFTVPVIVTRKASTYVHMRPGENLVIGGLKQFEKSKSLKRVPILGQIPVINWFFSTTRVETIEKELLIVVSPEMVEAAAMRAPPLPTDRPEKEPAKSSGK